MRRLWPRTDRGQILAMFAVAFATLGLFGYVLASPPPSTDRSLIVPFTLARVAGFGNHGEQAWGGIFIACGVGAAVLAYSRHTRDRWGYTILASLAGCWSLSFLGGLCLGAGLRSLVGFVIYGVFALILYKMSGLREEAAEGSSWG
jgi:hypothetical protein